MFEPPKLKKGDDFEVWKKDIKIWQHLTDLVSQKHAAAIYLYSLDEEIKQYCQTVPIEHLTSEGGVKVLFEKLEGLYNSTNNVPYNDGFGRSRDVEQKYVEDYMKEFNDLCGKNKELKSENIFNDEKENEMNIMPEEIGGDGDKNEVLKCILDDFKDIGKSNLQIINQLNESTDTDEETNRMITNDTKTKSHNVKISDRLNKKKEDAKRKNHSVEKKSILQCSTPKPKSSSQNRSKQCIKEENDIVKDSKRKNTKDMKQFLSETLNAAVLDSGCSKTVCGKAWLDYYINGLSKEDLLKIIDQKSETIFKFGDGKTVHSIGKVVIPAQIGNIETKIETDVIEEDIPLLLSKDSMKSANTTIDFSNDKVIMLNQTLDLIFTKSGHYCVSIKTTNNTEVKELLNLCGNSIEDKRKVSMKFHQQLGHIDSEKIVELVKEFGVEDIELFQCIKEAERKCPTCKSNKKKRLRPVVRFALAKEFNEIVSIDLKTYENVYLLHIIDHSTRYSAIAIINSKDTDVIIDRFNKYWVSLFGCPNKIQTDEKGDLHNNLYVKMEELFKVQVKITTFGSNSTAEKNYCLIISILDKVTAQSDSLHDAIAWAVSAKNSLANVYGFSPNELVFGKNPSFPTIMDCDLPSLEENSSSELSLSDDKCSTELTSCEENTESKLPKRPKSRMENSLRGLNRRMSLRKKKKKKKRIDMVQKPSNQTQNGYKRINC